MLVSAEVNTTDRCQEEGKKEEGGEVLAKSEPEQSKRLTYVPVFRDSKSPQSICIWPHLQATEYHNRSCHLNPRNSLEDLPGWSSCTSLASPTVDQGHGTACKPISGQEPQALWASHLSNQKSGPQVDMSNPLATTCHCSEDDVSWILYTA